MTTLIPALLLFFTVRIPAIFMLGYWFFIQFFSAVTSTGGASKGGVAWWAHVGGFLLGALLGAVMRPQTRVAVEAGFRRGRLAETPSGHKLLENFFFEL